MDRKEGTYNLTQGCADLGSTSANCPSTHPICNGTHECETPDECQTDPDCNEALGHFGICEPDVAEQTQCWYCDSEAGRKVCKPGIHQTFYSQVTIPFRL